MAAAKQIWRAAAVAVVLAAQAVWGADVQTTKPAATEAQGPEKREIVVSLEDRKLALVEDGQVVKVYPVAVGKPSTPSPVGTFTIERRAENPTYHHDGKTIPPGPGNPVGTRWMGLNIKGYGIHGTNEPKSIGKAASHGCIRMAKADLEELYPLVAVGDTVELVGHRDEETARLFGDGATPAPATEPVLAESTPAPAPAAQATTAQTAAAQTAPAANAATSIPATALAVFAGAL